MLQKKNAEMTKKMEELEEVDLWFLTCRNIFLCITWSVEDFVLCALLNPLTPMSDQDRISPYNINTISTR